MDKEEKNLFVSGRLCLFGEHSDWAGSMRIFNEKIYPGEAIVTGIEQGIYATVTVSEEFVFYFQEDINKKLKCKMEKTTLRKIAENGGYFSYVAGVAEYMCKYYKVGGLEIAITNMTLLEKRGLSSSAAVCVLVVRAFNNIYNLKLSLEGEMQAAFWGERMAKSKCGRLDQVCAYGIQPMYMKFDGLDIITEPIQIKKKMFYVIADLGKEKNTIKILTDLRKCYPYPQTYNHLSVQDALGKKNHAIICRARKYIEEGELGKLGKLMSGAQKIFDQKVAPACKEELEAPELHKILNDKVVKEYIYGGKGVGSQGDGCVQFLAKNKECQQKLIKYLRSRMNMESFSLTLKPDFSVKTAIIPVAGLGTRLYPATKVIKKDFFPIIDRDGYVKPMILILMTELIEAGIETIFLVINSREDEKLYNRLLEENYEGAIRTNDFTELERKMREIKNRIRFVIQERRKGFADAVYQCKKYIENEPVLLALGDTIYRSGNSESCTEQLLAYYERIKTPMLSIFSISIQEASNYGMVYGNWLEEDVLQINKILEKPGENVVKKELGVQGKNAKEYYSVFGEYIFVPAMFEVMEKKMKENNNREIELTEVLEDYAKKERLLGVKINGIMFDIGMPDKYKYTNEKYSE